MSPGRRSSNGRKGMKQGRCIPGALRAESDPCKHIADCVVEGTKSLCAYPTAPYAKNTTLYTTLLEWYPPSAQSWPSLARTHYIINRKAKASRERVSVFNTPLAYWSGNPAFSLAWLVPSGSSYGVVLAHNRTSLLSCRGTPSPRSRC